jgi:hypothetical protein
MTQEYMNRYLFLIIFSLGMLMVGACASMTDPEPPRPAAYIFTPVMPKNLAMALRHADAVVQGPIKKIEAKALYDDPCGIMATLMHRCDGTRAYRVTVRTIRGDAEFMIFVPHNDYQPLPLGLAATFLLSKQWIIQFQKCRQGAPYTSGAVCPSLGDMAFVLLSTEDVLPLDALMEQ